MNTNNPLDFKIIYFTFDFDKNKNLVDTAADCEYPGCPNQKCNGIHKTNIPIGFCLNGINFYIDEFDYNEKLLNESFENKKDMHKKKWEKLISTIQILEKALEQNT